VAELQAARAARLRFPDRVAVYTLEVRALAARLRRAEVEEFLREAESRARFTPGELGGLALEAASELWAHGDSVGGYPLLGRAAQLYERQPSVDTVATRWGRLQVAAQQGRWSRAVQLGERLVADHPALPNYRGALGVALARSGNVDRARTILDSLANDRHSYPVGFTQFEAARIAAALGEASEAARLIEAAHARGYPFNLEPHRDQALGTLRNHPLLAPSDAPRR
jgi:hypothetical protein